MGEVEAVPQNGEGAKSNNDSVELDSSLLHERILTQIEYYFGDVNLAKDRFLNEQIKKEDGWVPIETLLTFNRLSNICSDASVIAEALANSTLVKVNEDGTKVRRDPTKPVPESSEEVRKELMKRTVYVKGFPLEGISLDDLLPFFKKYGSVDSVNLRHYLDKATNKRGFKGSTFTIFSSVEEAEKFLKIDEVVYNDVPLKRLWQNDYIDAKRQERLDSRLSKQKRRGKNNVTKVGDADDEKETKHDKQSKRDKKEKKGLPTGSVVNLTNIPGEVERDDIRRVFEAQGFPAAFVDLQKAEKSALVRLEKAGGASELLEKLGENKKISIGDGEADIRVLEGEEEADYLDRARSQMARARQGRKKGGNQRGRKRKFDGGEDGPNAKVAAVESS